MKYIYGIYYVEVKDKRYKTHPTKNNILGERDPPKSLRTPNQFQNNTQIKKNQKVIGIDKNELVVKNYPKKQRQPVIQQKNETSIMY